MKLVIANLKMNLLFSDIKKYKSKLEDANLKDIIIAPSMLYLSYFSDSSINICSQNGYDKDSGAFTGKSSFKQLKSLGVKYALIGHSERRSLSKEGNDVISLKVESALRNEIIPILCIGETKSDKEDGKTFKVLKEELEVLKDKNIDSIIIAYEHVWAIGTGLVPPIDDIEKVHKFIKKEVKTYCDNFKIVYGGSVKLDNVKEICDSKYVDGVLIGGASNDADNLIKMYNVVNNV